MTTAPRVLINFYKNTTPSIYHDLTTNDQPVCGADVRGGYWGRVTLDPVSDSLCVCARCMRARVEAARPTTDDYRCVVCQRYGPSRFCDDCAAQHPDRFALYLDTIYPAKESV